MMIMNHLLKNALRYNKSKEDLFVEDVI
jgi:hypothetical protein